ncbi:sensor domain-containing diguanylate cyclase [Syntrophotalea acetylenivorans]|nr:sensor domain-containing diguanylate cyclase [Syntrophotalea acetylenivorans]
MVDQDELYRVMEKKECMRYENLQNNPVKLNIVLGELVPDSIAFIPLRYQDQKIGVAILLAKNEFARSFSGLESKNFIQQATPFLYNSNLIRRLEELAAMDELTGSLNRRFGMKRLQEEFSRAQRFSTSFSLCLIDIDHFKTINDTFGHQAGDEVLRSVTTQMQGDLRSSDFIVRYGGEEFLLVLPGASLADSYEIMERMRRRIEAFQLQFGSYSINFTISSGICSFPSKNITEPSDMIRAADITMYKAKNSGRNRIMTTEE